VCFQRFCSPVGAARVAVIGWHILVLRAALTAVVAEAGIHADVAGAVFLAITVCVARVNANVASTVAFTIAIARLDVQRRIAGAIAI